MSNNNNFTDISKLTDYDDNVERVVRYDNGDTYEGKFKDGKFDGKAVFTFSHGDKYEGEFKDGKRNGRGVFTYINGDVYAGEFKDGKLSGKAVFTFANGDKYEGEFKDGKLSGKVVITYSNGDAYEGEFKDGKLSGKVVITYSDGDKYEGEFKDGKCNGIGVFTFKNGYKYKGEFKDGKPNGTGVFTFKNGDLYEGEFKDGKMTCGTLILKKDNKILTVKNSVIQTKKNNTNIKIIKIENNYDINCLELDKNINKVNVVIDLHGLTDTDSFAKIIHDKKEYRTDYFIVEIIKKITDFNPDIKTIKINLTACEQNFNNEQIDHIKNNIGKTNLTLGYSKYPNSYFKYFLNRPMPFDTNHNTAKMIFNPTEIQLINNTIKCFNDLRIIIPRNTREFIHVEDTNVRIKQRFFNANQCTNDINKEQSLLRLTADGIKKREEDFGPNSEKEEKRQKIEPIYISI